MYYCAQTDTPNHYEYEDVGDQAAGDPPPPPVANEYLVPVRAHEGIAAACGSCRLKSNFAIPGCQRVLVRAHEGVEPLQPARLQ